MLTVYQIADLLQTILWAMLRVSGVVLIAPILGAVFVPQQVRILLAACLAVAMLPAIGAVPAYSPLSMQGLLTIARELAVGLAMGFALKLVVEAAVFAGQVVSMGMGLSFATVVDPQAGSVPLLGRFYIIVATLLLLAADAHLALVRLVAESYSVLPIGDATLAAGSAREEPREQLPQKPAAARPDIYGRRGRRSLAAGRAGRERGRAQTRRRGPRAARHAQGSRPEGVTGPGHRR